MNQHDTVYPIARSAGVAFIAFASVAVTAVQGQLATYPNLEPWFATLQKPNFNPPNWVFAPVWTTLYLLMAFAFWRILRLPKSEQRRNAIVLFALMLVLNGAWSWMFFAAHNPLLGLINIVPQLGIVVAVIIAFMRLDTIAAVALVPLAAWVGFASILNFSIWQLNG